MSQRILKANGKVVPRRTVRPLSTAQLHCEVEKKKRSCFNKLIEGRWGNTINPSNGQIKVKTVTDDENSNSTDFEEYGDEKEKLFSVLEIDEPVDARGMAINVNPLMTK